MSQTATLRQWLTEAGFDWNAGRIVVQDDDYQPTSARWVEQDDPMLDEVFETGFGHAGAPCFIAEDATAIYFPDQYDGSTSCVRVWKDITRYLKLEANTPYPGGG